VKQLTRLFSPLKINSMELKNRIVMAPMGNGQANADGSVSQQLIISPLRNRRTDDYSGSLTSCSRCRYYHHGGWY
jgi:2,4-dienoyl-CoA reductase-like NADH-dependent reductase (Old Yellow Enzyme family)